MPDRFWTWTATDASGQVQPVLHAFSGTEAGLAALAVGDGPARWASRVAALRPELALDTSRALVTTWNDDPVGRRVVLRGHRHVADGDDRAHRRAPGPGALRRRAHRRDWAGLMEGALRSGARAAAEVLAHARC